MANIETLIVPYSKERSGIATTSGTSVGGKPSEYAAFDHFNIWVPPPSFIASGHHSYPSFKIEDTNFTGEKGLIVEGAMVFLAADTSQDVVTFKIRRPRMWTDGIVTMRLHYTGIGASPADPFNLQIKLWTVTGSTITSRVDDLVTLDSPTTTGQWMTAKLDENGDTQVPVSTSSDTEVVDAIIAGFQAITRDVPGGDWAEDLHFLGMELMFKPTEDQSIDASYPAYLNRND